MERVKCPRCDGVNSANSSSCVYCGFGLQAGEQTGVGTAEVLESRPARTAVRNEDPSPVALVGFGAITALAAAVYPWYLFGDPTATGSTLSEVLEVGWRGFPGIPLALIVTAAIASTTVMLLPVLASARAPIVVVSGLVTLISASWLSEGITRLQSGSVDSTLPITGAMLQTIGAIVLIATGFWLGRTQATGGAFPEDGSAPSPTEEDPAHRTQTSYS